MTNQQDIAALRKNYSQSSLLETEANKDAILQFQDWFSQALSAELTEPNAMCLSTVNDGKPQSRIVLLKGIEHEGFVFFTNYNSSKGRQISTNPYVSLNFAWLELERQVRIFGVSEKITAKESDDYFNSRPLESRVGALVSAQSENLDSRESLEKAMAEAMLKYKDTAPQRPEHWGGFLVKPETIEFWQGRPGRLHDRLLYTKQNQGWKISRLYP